MHVFCYFIYRIDVLAGSNVLKTRNITGLNVRFFPHSFFREIKHTEREVASTFLLQVISARFFYIFSLFSIESKRDFS